MNYIKSILAIKRDHIYFKPMQKILLMLAAVAIVGIAGGCKKDMHGGAADGPDGEHATESGQTQIERDKDLIQGEWRGTHSMNGRDVWDQMIHIGANGNVVDSWMRNTGEDKRPWPRGVPTKWKMVEYDGAVDTDILGEREEGNTMRIFRFMYSEHHPEGRDNPRLALIGRVSQRDGTRNYYPEDDWTWFRRKEFSGVSD